MLTDHGHPEIGTLPAAVALRDGEAQMACGVGKVFRFPQQRLPFMPRQSTIVEIGARPFAAMIEEADVVVGLFQRFDLARDEAVEFVEIGDQVGRQCKIHGAAPSFLSLSAIKVRRRTPSQAANSSNGIWLVARGLLA